MAMNLVRRGTDLSIRTQNIAYTEPAFIAQIPVFPGLPDSAQLAGVGRWGSTNGSVPSPGNDRRSSFEAMKQATTGIAEGWSTPLRNCIDAQVNV